jgi:hypothetical protein
VRKQAPEWVGAPQKRFAWAIGWVLAVTMLWLIVINNVIGPINMLVCATCLTLMFFESAFGICIGCKIYNALRDWLGAQGGKLKVIEIDMDSAAGEKRLKEIGIKGHVPVVVLVDGQYRHKRADGSTVEFVSFPSGPGTPPGVTGAWSAVDVEAVIKSRKP